MAIIDKNRQLIIDGHDIKNYTANVADDARVGILGFLNTLRIRNSKMFSFDGGGGSSFVYTEDDPDSFLVLSSLLRVNIAMYDLRQHNLFEISKTVNIREVHGPFKETPA